MALADVALTAVMLDSFAPNVRYCVRSGKSLEPMR
ncbi:hypothetical protein BN13_420050 [Nostocoides jenkinsii Ben 74]|uniref:Uncharacterized protein n=1 Tax=Nostocoides jenkinsii Ben 74 TaxID=1193518 RepID=A0A077M8F4_9MICO|nr:hypothetical protein BN13_420050 [Tetrasphaera jenkinsii Ben 74]